jgi:hypothetical protein
MGRHTRAREPEVPPVIKLTDADFAGLLDLSPAHFRRTFAGTLPLAWGVTADLACDLYALDLVGVRIAQELAFMTGQPDAAAIVQTHSDHWMEALGRSEHDSERRTFYFAVAVAGHGPSKEFLISSGLPEQILADINDAVPPFPHHRICTVNVTKIAADLRERGARRGIDLRQAFFLPPDHPEFAELIGDYAEQRREAVEALKRGDPKRYAKVKREPIGRAL